LKKEKSAIFEFIDAHVHFYDMHHPQLYYGDWQPNKDHPILGSQTRKLGKHNYLAEDFIQESTPYGMAKAIHIQAAIGSKNPVLETQWLQEAFDRTGIPQAIVGYVDLRSPNAQQEIEQHMEFENFKGIRDFSYGDYLVNDQFKQGFSLLSKYRLISSISAQWEEMEKLSDLARSYPDITIVLDHAGFPRKRTWDYFKKWRKNMSLIANEQNIICKISGLGMGDHNWNTKSIRPYVETCIELFGFQRVLFGTNWPIDSLWSNYSKVINAYRVITNSYTKTEQNNFFKKNAERLYQI